MKQSSNLSQCVTDRSEGSLGVKVPVASKAKRELSSNLGSKVPVRQLQLDVA